MVEALDVAAVNIGAAYIGMRVLPKYAVWVWKDWNRLRHLFAGPVVFTVTILLAILTYEAGYYAAARLLAEADVANLRQWPWTAWIVVVRAGVILAMIGAYAGWLRADGAEWPQVYSRSLMLGAEAFFVTAVLLAFL